MDCLSPSGVSSPSKYAKGEPLSIVPLKPALPTDLPWRMKVMIFRFGPRSRTDSECKFIMVGTWLVGGGRTFASDFTCLRPSRWLRGTGSVFDLRCLGLGRESESESEEEDDFREVSRCGPRSESNVNRCTPEVLDTSVRNATTGALGGSTSGGKRPRTSPVSRFMEMGAKVKLRPSFSSGISVLTKSLSPHAPGGICST
mmetsp:Transcript_23506/g.61830  ORF Transcript_23506/g.61830 Transcript_23506/m.61830 type:complete len:200 (+) Transcript_23506:1398-1997(+)